MKGIKEIYRKNLLVREILISDKWEQSICELIRRISIKKKLL